ncbi:MAG: hypothetical protein HZB16_13520 [Armatimonadetes bacterium]|nr:hypothetical protein [Armatimonadota bacterium]
MRLDALVAADSAWARVDGLRLTATQLRLAADQVAPLVLPELPPTQVKLPENEGPRDEDLSRRAAAMELQILRESHLSQIASARRRALAASLPALQREWLTTLRDSKLANLARSTGLSEAQGAERINLDLQLAAVAGAEAMPWDVERNALDAAEGAVAALWRADLEDGATAWLRDRLARQTAELDAIDAEAVAVAEGDVAARRAEQEASAALLAAAAAATPDKGLGPLAGPLLDLSVWRTELAAALAEGEAARGRRAARWRLAADSWEQHAEHLTRDLRADLATRLSRRLGALATMAQVRIELAPTGGLPDVTDLAAVWLAGSEEHPEWLVPALPAASDPDGKRP